MGTITLQTQTKHGTWGVEWGVPFRPTVTQDVQDQDEDYTPCKEGCGDREKGESTRERGVSQRQGHRERERRTDRLRERERRERARERECVCVCE